MASHTIELQFLLRGFTEFNDKPMLYASPRSIIENAHINFFKTIGDYNFKIWGDERDTQFKENLEKNFLEYFLEYEINAQTPDAFILRLGSFFRRKVPVFCQHWRVLLEEMYMTNTGNTAGKTNATDKIVTDLGSVGIGANQTTSDSKTDSEQLGGISDTPQNELNIDVRNVKFATSVNKGVGTSDANSKSAFNSVDNFNSHSEAVRNASGGSNVDSFGRSKDVFDIYDQWLKSGYDLFTPFFIAAKDEKLFLLVF
jgi:hypothetical protein